MTDGERYYAVRRYGPPQAQADFLQRTFPNRRITKGLLEKDYVQGVDWNGMEVWNWYPSGYPRFSGQKVIEQANFVYKTLDQSLLETVTGWDKYDSVITDIGQAK